ncbi:MAG: FAD-dependent oxidoreductase [Dehalococcoidia bacterium]|nr:FAD-dependent oxidoreductase [Dehalococcoidia bacterium]
MNSIRDTQPENVQTIIVGGGQAGLAAGYHLARRGLPFAILDANERVGDAWRKRWDSLRLFSPAAYDSLPGMPFPAAGHEFPTKDEMADYLEAYSERFELPVRTGVAVERLTKEGDRFVLTAGGRRFEAENVVVAMANYQRPRVPAFAAELGNGVVQLHSADYRNPAQLQDGPVLVVGAGNSGAEIAFEVARSHETWLSGNASGEVPFRIDGLAARLLLLRLVLRVFFHRVLTVDTPIGRRARRKLLTHGMPLLRVKSAQLAAAGVGRVARTTGTRDGKPVLEDGRVMDVANVIWCTGFEAGFSWIDLPVFSETGAPLHEKGVAGQEPGLYFIGLHFLYAVSSAMVQGVGRDAERIAEAIAGRVGATLPAVEGIPTLQRRAG